VGEALPALEPEGLVSQIQGPAVDKEHPAVRPFHRHVVKDGKKRGIPYQFVTVHACRIASAYLDPVQERVIVVAEDRLQLIFMGECMDHFQRFAGPISPVNEISEVDKDLDRAEYLPEQRGPDT